jgi:hypothetical protein
VAAVEAEGTLQFIGGARHPTVDLYDAIARAQATMEQFSSRAHIGFMRKPINMEILRKALLGVGIKQQE